ncbi:multiple myeloma tumor-associated protein 2 homolog [Zingiber officinale]|uniref:multiple myeloma tumor-associated protein 2 homolog n=1 Tax=Zingiber officinale TaxID=94328 RepID=UPI001C4CF911|nr:multiple myeloma tumor-associated protein 2 homolog [Zingiber officinale]
MYHPSRGGVRGGRDQFNWDDVKVDKHRENYLGHSVKAPVGRWQKGKDLSWYARDKKSASSEMDSVKEEIRRIKEEEEQAMREALGLAPKRAGRPQGNRLDKHEYAELVKRGSTAEDLGAQHAEAIVIQGLGVYKAPRNQPELSTLPETMNMAPSKNEQTPISQSDEDLSVDKSEKRRREEKSERRHDRSRDKRRGEERGDEERKHRKHHEKKQTRDSDHKREHHNRNKEKRRHDSD